MQLRLEVQQNQVADEVSAMVAIVRPILQGLLFHLNQEVVKELNGHPQIALHMLARNYRPGDGDVGICFEYAVHDAIVQQNPLVMPRVADALAKCNLPGHDIGSILFGAEKSGAIDLIETAASSLTDDSSLLYGRQGRPVKLKKHIQSVAAAFRGGRARNLLPDSISGLWKADLFTGCTDTDKWVGTTLKINRTQLVGARGLRLGIVPAHEGESDAIVLDSSKNLVICPLPYDGSFVQMFYQAWEVVTQFIRADARVPREAYLPRPSSRQVARFLQDRRSFPVLDVIDALHPMAQPHLLAGHQEALSQVPVRTGDGGATAAVLAPIPAGLKQ